MADHVKVGQTGRVGRGDHLVGQIVQNQWHPGVGGTT
jgi:hypothetical protein